MPTRKIIDEDVIYRLNSEKSKQKRALYSLSLAELLTLPFRRFKPIGFTKTIGKKQVPHEKNIQLVSDLVYAKIEDLKTYRDIAYQRIIQEALHIPINEKTKHIHHITDERELLKRMFDPANFPTSAHKFLKYSQDKRNKNKKLKEQTLFERFKQVQNHFNPHQPEYLPEIERLANSKIDIELDVFPSKQWLYGAKRLKTYESVARNFSKMISERIVELPEKKRSWNLKNQFQNLYLNDLVGMAFISKETINLNDRDRYEASHIKKVVRYLYDESLFEIREGEYKNKYKDKCGANSLRMYLRPRKELFEYGTVTSFTPYADRVEGLPKTDLVLSLHVQDVRSLIQNKVFDRSSHHIYKHKQQQEYEQFLLTLPDWDRLKHFDLRHGIESMLTNLNINK